MPLLLGDGDEFRGQILGHGHAVGERVAVHEPRSVVDHFLEQGLTQAHDRGAFVLSPTDEGVDGLAGVSRNHQLMDGDETGIGVYLDIRGPPAQFPEDALRFQGCGMIGLRLVEAVGGKFPARAAEISHDHRRQRQGFIALANVPILEVEVLRLGAQAVGGKIQYLCSERPGGPFHGLAHDRNGRTGIRALVVRRVVGIDRHVTDPSRRRTQYFGDDGGERRMSALADFHRAAMKEYIAESGHLDAGLRRLVHPAAVLEAERQTDPPVGEGIFLALVVADFAGDQFQSLAEVAVHAAFAGHERLAEIDQVLHAKFKRIHTQAVGDHVHLGFARPACLGAAEAPEWSGGRRIGHDAVAGRPDVPVTVGSGNPITGLLGDQRACIGVSAGIQENLAIAGNQRAVVHHPGLQYQDRRVLGVGEKVLVVGEGEPDRPAGHPREQYGDGFRFAVVFRAVAAAHKRDADADTVLGQLEHPAQFLAEREGILTAGRHFDPVAVQPLGDRGEGFQVEMLHAGEVKGVFENMVAGLEDVRRTGLVVEPVAHVGPGAKLGRGAGAIGRDDPHGRLFEQFGRAVGECVFDRGDRRKFFVLDLDQAQRRIGDGLGFGGDRRHRVALVPHLIQRDDGLILDEIAVGRCDIIANRVAGQNRMNTGQLAGGRGIYADKPGMGDGAPQRLGVQHAGQRYVGRVAGLAAHLFPRVPAPRRPADNFEARAFVHRIVPGFAASAALATASTIIS